MSQVFSKRIDVRGRFLVPALVALAGFLLGYIHHRWFFPLDFHADAAAMQVLAQAMVDEGSLLPRDFGYGNQLILFRSSPFIALALLCGAAGYDAYVLGSALSIAFWLLLLYRVLAACLDSRPLAMLVALLFIVPMSVWDNDYLLGQQSHLSNAVMAACTVLAASLYGRRASSAWLAVGAGLVFLMATEAPVRALLVTLPALLGAFLYFERRAAARLAGALGLALAAGVGVNKLLLISRPLGLDLFSTMVFRSAGEVVETLYRLALEMFGAVSMMNLFAAKRIEAGAFILYAAALAYLAVVCAFAAWRARALAARVRARAAGKPAGDASPAWDFPAAVALIGVAVGALAVALLNPDTARHVIWAGALLRLSLLMAACQLALRVSARPVLGLLVVVLATALPSHWLATVYKFRGHIDQSIQARNYPAIHEQLRRHAEELKISRVYGGNFWRMHTLNATLPHISAGTLSLVGEDGLAPDYWLSRVSLFDREQQVLYYLSGDKVDKVIRARLEAAGARQLFAAGDDSIWAGPAVWTSPTRAREWQGCKLPSNIGRPTLECYLEKKHPDLAGYLSFGPYAQLEPGDYTIELEYDSPSPAKDLIGEWDVAATGSFTTVMLAGRLKGTGGRPGYLREHISIGRGVPAGALEVRVNVRGGVGVRVRKLRIVREGRVEG